MIADRVRISKIKTNVEPFFIINKGKFNDKRCNIGLEPCFEEEGGFYNNGLMFVTTSDDEVGIFYDGSMVASKFPSDTSIIKIKAKTNSGVYTTIETSWSFDRYRNFGKDMKRVEDIHFRVGDKMDEYKLFTEYEIVQNIQDNENSIINIPKTIKIKPVSGEVDIDIVFPFPYDCENPPFALDCFIESLVLY